MNINIQVIPHAEHRYKTSGDYWEESDMLQVRVSDMGDWRKEMLVAIHELNEFLICKHRDIKEPDIAAFDIQYEKEREKGLHGKDDEPGFDENAPYVKEHTFATGVEMLLAQQLDVDWNEYNKTVMSL